MNKVAANNKDFHKDKVVCYGLAHFMIYSFFFYATSNVAKCTFNPVISFVRMTQGLYSLGAVS